MSFSGTVRELKNRITFDVNKGSVANYKSAFSGMKADAASIIKKAASIGIALTVAGQKFYMDQEKNKASISFYAKTNADAKELLGTIKEFRGKTEIISESDLTKGVALFGQLNVKVGDLRKTILPLLKDINIANPQLGGFSGVMDLLNSWVEGGDLDALKKFGAIGKEMAEALSFTSFDQSVGKAGQENRLNIILSEMIKNAEKYKKLANDVRKTNDFAFRGVTKELSDFTLNFGNSTKSVNELVKSARDFLKEVNNSKQFWGILEKISDGIFKNNNLELNDKRLEDLLLNHNQYTDEKNKEEFKKRKPDYMKLLQDSPEPGIPTGSRTKDKKEGKFREGIVDTILGGLKYGVGMKEGGLFENKSKENKINLSGTITVEGKNMGGFDPRSLQEQINSTVKELAVDPLRESLKSIKAFNGGYVSLSGGL